MVNEVRAMAEGAGAATTDGRIEARVLDAMARVPRHRFVSADQAARAYENRPLPIGHGQTISQPYIVALMTDLLGVQPGDRVFELGTGSGYQAAVLAELGCNVWSVEIVAELGKRAEEVLAELGYDKVTTRVGDAYYGWKEEAPFDAIVVTAAGDHVPPPLIEQLKPGGRMMIPVGTSFLTQQLMLVEKLEDGSIRSREILPVAFVPLTGGH
ncbi:MAG: protein-L-isoaspartate(D-aspartate) O-methyltransferase [Pseudomonadota bacterium]